MIRALPRYPPRAAEMLPHETRQPLPHGKLAENTLHFARLLRAAGLPVGTDRALLMLQALRVAGLASRAELHDVLQACLINRAEHRALFDQAFRLFWSEPDRLGGYAANALGLMNPEDWYFTK